MLLSDACERGVFGENWNSNSDGDKMAIGLDDIMVGMTAGFLLMLIVLLCSQLLVFGRNLDWIAGCLLGPPLRAFWARGECPVDEFSQYLFRCIFASQINKNAFKNQ